MSMLAANDEFTDSLYDFFPAQITAVATGTGAQAGMNLYAWREQEYDITTGKFRDAVPGRSGTTSSAYALEVNNQVVSPLPAYVMMRCMGAVNGNLTYLFQSPTSAGAGAGLVTASAYGYVAIPTTVPGDGTATLVNCYYAVVYNPGARTVLSILPPDGYLHLPNAGGTHHIVISVTFFPDASAPPDSLCWVNVPGFSSNVYPIAAPLLPFAGGPFPHAIINVGSNVLLGAPVALGIFAAQSSGLDATVTASFWATYVGP